MTEGVDRIRLELVKKYEKDQRNIYKARCCKELGNHRSMKYHLQNCSFVHNQQTITNFLKSYYSPPIDKLDLTLEQEELIVQ